MGKTLIPVIAFVIGLVGGALGGMTLGGGATVGAGAAAGLSTAICSTARAAQEEGFMTTEQIGPVPSRAAKDLSGAAELPAGEGIVERAAACEKVLARLRETTCAIGHSGRVGPAASRA
jgi:hypothetical protein